MRIIYLGQHGNTKSDNTEGHITRALKELGHEVLRLHEDTVNIDDLPEGDVFLFHKGGRRIEEILKKINYKKVCWYFDKIWKMRIHWFNKIYPLVDVMFMTDGTWAERFPKCKILRQGIGDVTDGKKGKMLDVVFTGSLYETRIPWFSELKARFNIHHIHNVFNEELNDLCASSKIIVAPKYPSDAFYWSNRVYLITGSGGFLIHPFLHGLYEEWGDNLVYYRTDEGLYEKIEYYLKHDKEREEMRKRMVKFCRNNFTYKQRVEQLCQNL